MTDLAQKKPKAVDDFQLEEIDGESLLYSPKATRSIYLNPSASLIWKLCDGQNSTEDIIVALQQAFPDNADDIAKDVQTTIDDFIANESVILL